MICPNCKQDIPVSSDYCPECGARQTQKEKQQRFKIAPYVVCIVVLLIIISSLSESIVEKLDENGSNTANKTVTHSTTATTAPSQRAVMENKTDREENEREFAARREPSPFDDDIIDVDIDDCHIEYLYHEVVQNMADDLCVAVYYQFTNNSNTNQAFYVTVSDKAFQNGVELEESFFHVNDDSKTREMEIQPGVSVTVCSGFVLRDTSDIELQVSPWISFDNTPSDAMMLSLESEG